MEEPTQTVPYPNSYWVVPGKFLAGEYPGDADTAIAKMRLQALLDSGVRTFVDLTDEDEINEDAKPVPKYRALLRALADEQRIETTYLRIPIQDRCIPSVWTLRRILDLIDRSIFDENPVFVHCWAGRGRAGTVTGCYLKRHGLAGDQDVVQKIGALRRFMPNGRDSSPHTEVQVRMVTSWKKGA